MSVSRVQFRIRKTLDGYEGMLVLPTTLQAVARKTLQASPGAAAALPPEVKQRLLTSATPLAVKSKPGAPDAASSIEEAAELAERVLDNPIVQDLLPPGSATAVAAAKKAAQLVKSGDAEAALKKAGSAIKSVAQGITSIF